MQGGKGFFHLTNVVHHPGNLGQELKQGREGVFLTSLLLMVFSASFL